jgi:Glyoxalase-like domain
LTVAAPRVRWHGHALDPGWRRHGSPSARGVLGAGLGYVAEPGHDQEAGASIVDPAGVGPAIGFLQVPKVAKNRFHIDIRVAGKGPVDPALREHWVRAKSAELVDAGATVVREDAYDAQFSHIVMRDPEGNEVCVA